MTASYRCNSIMLTRIFFLISVVQPRVVAASALQLTCLRLSSHWTLSSEVLHSLQYEWLLSKCSATVKATSCPCVLTRAERVAFPRLLLSSRSTPWTQTSSLSHLLCISLSTSFSPCVASPLATSLLSNSIFHLQSSLCNLCKHNAYYQHRIIFFW